MQALESIVRVDNALAQAKARAISRSAPVSNTSKEEPKLVTALVLKGGCEIAKIGPASILLNTVSRKNSAIINYAREYRAGTLYIIGTPLAKSDGNSPRGGGLLTLNNYDFLLERIEVKHTSEITLIEKMAINGHARQFVVTLGGMCKLTLEKLTSVQCLEMDCSGSSMFRCESFFTKNAKIMLRDTCNVDEVCISEEGTVEAEGRVTATVVQQQKSKVSVFAANNALPIKCFEETTGTKKRKRRALSISGNKRAVKGVAVSDVAPPQEYEREVEKDEQVAQKMCTMDCSRPIATTIVPCGHCLYCVTCSNKCVSDAAAASDTPLECPICQTPVSQYLKLIFPE
jgi:hypothetical protein